MPKIVPHEVIQQVAGEFHPDHWLVNEDESLDDNDQIQELLDTGSVTTVIAGLTYEVSLVFTQIDETPK